ncbi:MAG TPA: hypothetical protein VEQ40_11450, partial [Pyrinomonadaceae bacterium]|nr:hypothetical protein [Pyrinomonadaceae bacterium]
NKLKERRSSPRFSEDSPLFKKLRISPDTFDKTRLFTRRGRERDNLLPRQPRKNSGAPAIFRLYFDES